MTALAFLVGNWRWIAGIGAGLVIAALYLAWQNEASRAEALAVDLRTTQAELVASRRSVVALERAATERAIDEREVTTMSKDLTDAIEQAAAREPAATPGPATVALGCQRMRQAGRTSTDAYRRICGR